ncbi:hypothetical protein B484DRAFT_417299 [Ochromonadaceae sp. CCMP2298]|nr:hypothetical protein B484DRAFT_417299 [Ochromonadaceae sp. CCMP2298]
MQLCARAPEPGGYSTTSERKDQHIYLRCGIFGSLGVAAVLCAITVSQELSGSKRNESTSNYGWLALAADVLILACVAQFAVYDFYMRNEFTRADIVLDTKRRFVRFISHEMRTPLNTVNMGMTLFGLELDCMREIVLHMGLQLRQMGMQGMGMGGMGQGMGQGMGGIGGMGGMDLGLGLKYGGQGLGGQGQGGQGSLEHVQKCLLEKISELRSIVSDVTTSTDAAVDTLNDLLNYDKIESGIFVIEFALVSIAELLQRSMAAFLLQVG